MRSPQDDLDRWLDAEREDRADEADAALRALFAAMPALSPPAGFADRVLLRAALAGTPAMVPARRSVFASLWVRSLLVLSFLAIAVSVLWLPQTLRALAGLWSVGGVVRAWTGSLIEACHWLSSVLGLWDLLVTIGRALAAPLETPTVAYAMVSCLLVSMVAFRFLRNLILRDRSWTHETV